MLEAAFQHNLIKEIESMFPECIVLKNDPGYLLGIPDLLILNGSNWVALEVKADSKAPFQPGQEYYISKMNAMSFCEAIFPENKEEVLYEVQRALSIKR